MSDLIEIEVDSPRNESLSFPPLQQEVRGRFLFHRVAEPMAMSKAEEWGTEIPGQRIGLNVQAKEGYVKDMLHDPQYQDAKRKVEAHKFKLPSPLEKYPLKTQDEIATWIYWMQRVVDAGIAKVISGRLPEKYEGTPRKNFLSTADSEAMRSKNDIATLLQALPQMIGQAVATGVAAALQQKK